MIETAIDTVCAQITRARAQELPRDFPPGEPHKIRRPPGPPSSWPELMPAAVAAAAAERPKAA